MKTEPCIYFVMKICRISENFIRKTTNKNLKKTNGLVKKVRFFLCGNEKNVLPLLPR